MSRTAKKPSASPFTDTAPQWSEEWVPLHSVIRHEPLQVREKLDPSAVLRYRDMAKNGQVPPPVKVARTPDGRLYLIDGWHRFEAGALQVIPAAFDSEDGGPEVLALVAPMSMKAARWEAAKANLGHGVPVTSRAERRNVFRAFVHAGLHRTKDGGFLSYRELAAAIPIGASFNGLRNWMRSDFPSIAARMSRDEDEPRAEGGSQEKEAPPCQHREHCAEVIRVAAPVFESLGKVTSGQRLAVVEALRAIVAEAERLGIEPDPEQEF